MARAFLLIRLTLVLVGLAASTVAAAGEPAKRPGSSFTLIVSAATPAGPGVAPSMGAGVPPKAIVRNPYNVPLLQTAGSFNSIR